jgi:hypothetical protein
MTMLPRSLLMTALLATMMTTEASAPAQTKSPPAGKAETGKAATPIVTTSTVYYRTKEGGEFSLFGYYSSEASARRVFEHLARTGYEAELRISNRPIPKLKPRTSTGPLPANVTVTYERVVEVFKLMVNQRNRDVIAFRYPVDGCYARAELMVEQMQRMGLKPYKIWSVANGEELFARTKNHPRGYVTWGYHVAPVVRVRLSENSQRWYVIDPSMSDLPMTITQWEQAQKRTSKSPRPYLTITGIGVPPTWVDGKKKPGTGYWPGQDPGMGKKAHALATMKKYKPWEGKAPPKATAWEPERRLPTWTGGLLARDTSVAWHPFRRYRALH